jgi:hypothetical protein
MYNFWISHPPPPPMKNSGRAPRTVAVTLLLEYVCAVLIQFHFLRVYVVAYQ